MNSSFEIVAERNKQISLIRQEILSSSNSKSLKHQINSEIPMKVTGLHTNEIDISVWADYNHGSIIHGYFIKTGECFHSQEWTPNPTIRFGGVFTSSDNLLALSNVDGKLNAYDIKKRRSTFADTQSNSKISDVVHTPENYLIVSSYDGSAYVYRETNWSLCRALYGNPNNAITSQALIPFSSSILLGYNDGSVAIVNYLTSLIYNTFKLSDKAINSVSASHKLFAASTEHELFIGDLKKGENHRTYYTPKITSVKIGLGDCWSHSPSLLNSEHEYDPWLVSKVYVGTEQGSILIKDLSRCGFETKINSHKAAISSMLISMDHHLITGSSDGTIRRVQLPSGNCTNIYYPSGGNISMAVSSNCKYFCISGFEDNKAKQINLDNGTTMFNYFHQNSVRALQFAKINNKEFLFTGGWDDRVCQWNLDDGQLINEYPVPGLVCDLNICNNRLAIGFLIRGLCCSIQVIDYTNNKIITTNMVNPPCIIQAKSVYLYLDNDFIYAGRNDGFINKWELSNNKLCRSFYHGSSIRSITVSSKEQILFSAAVDYTIKAWNTVSGDHIKTFYGNSGQIYSLVLSHDEKYLFSANEFGTITKFDISSGQLIQTLNYHEGFRVLKIKLSPDGNTLLTASEDGKIRFISAVNGELLGTYYSTTKGFLWTIPETENAQNGYYWTDCLEHVAVSAEYSDDNKQNKKLEEKQIADYHAIYNNQKLVMSRINSSKFFDIYKASIIQIKNEMLINRLTCLNQNKLLGVQQNNNK